MENHPNRLLTIVAALAVSAFCWTLSAAPEDPQDAALRMSSNPSAVIEGHAVVTPGPAPETYGSANTWVVATPWDAQPIDSTFTYHFNNFSGGQGISQSNVSGSVWVHIPVHLPNGALWTQIETNYCDTGAATMYGFIMRNAKNGAITTTTFLTSVGTPGCVVETATLTSPLTIDNNANQYYIEVNMGGVTDGSIIFGAMRFGYKLQVSPAPGVATFFDVPLADPRNKFVEALYQAGITAGCGGGNYCPDVAVTRGQMAVFLASALGLHWPN